MANSPGALPAAGCRADIAGAHVDVLAFDDIVAAIVARAVARGAPAYVVTPNAYHVVLLQRDALLREIYERAFLVVPDGVPLLWAGALLGTPLPGRVNGTDLFEALCACAAREHLRVFLLGGRPGAAAAAAVRLTARHPELNVCGTYCPPFGFENDATESAAVLAALERARPDLLFVGLGAPKQEYWMYRNCPHTKIPVALGIGVSFELVGGVVARAPRWMQRAGLEWLHRLGDRTAALVAALRFRQCGLLPLIGKAAGRAAFRQVPAPAVTAAARRNPSNWGILRTDRRRMRFASRKGAKD